MLRIAQCLIIVEGKTQQLHLIKKIIIQVNLFLIVQETKRMGRTAFLPVLPNGSHLKAGASCGSLAGQLAGLLLSGFANLKKVTWRL